MEATARSAALLAAAGSGERLGRGPKAFLELGGRTLLERTVEAVTPLVDEVVIAVPEGEEERARQIAPDALVIVGGSSRQASVLNLLGATDAALVLVHDVARPFLAGEVGQRVLEAGRRCGAATACRPVPDTLVDALSGSAVDRERLRSVQTPQAFDRELLLEAHRRAADEGRLGTDDASLVRALGRPVELVTGSPWLFKLTSREDFEFALAMARVWDAGA